jgi:hypothetical protein
LNIHYFFLADQVEKGNVIIEHCLTDEMVGNFDTKQLQGEKFRMFCDTFLDAEIARD